MSTHIFYTEKYSLHNVYLKKKKIQALTQQQKYIENPCVKTNINAIRKNLTIYLLYGDRMCGENL